MTDKETAMVDGGVAQKGGDLVDQDRAPLSPHVSRGLPVRQLAGLGHHPAPYQLLEYQTDMRRCRFDTLGKQTSAPLAGGPPPYMGRVPPARGVSADAASPGPPPARAGCHPARTVGGPGDAAAALTHRTHPPARWAEVYFPTGINLGQCSACT